MYANIRSKFNKTTLASQRHYLSCPLSHLFGLIYQGASYLYYALAATFLKPYANDLMLGIWLMAGPLAAILLKRRGAAFLGEFLGATAEMLLFPAGAPLNLITGALQGSASELGF